jgi:ABC-2 type transport system permease protein
MTPSPPTTRRGETTPSPLRVSAPPRLRVAGGWAEGVGLYWRLTGARARSQMQYKFSFAVLTVMGIVNTIVDFVTVVVIFGRIPTLKGWSLAEIAVLYAMAYISFSLAETFVRGFESIPRHLVQGTFDRILTRPLGAFFQIFASDLAVWKLGKLAQGAVVLLVAQRALAIPWTPDKLVVLGLALVSGAGIFFAITVIGAASCFWTIQANEAVNIFTNGGVTMTSFPLDVYDDWLRRLVTFVIPLGFINYYPALYLLGRPDPLGLPAWTGLLSPLAVVVLGVFAWGTWSLGVKHYTSTGN